MTANRVSMREYSVSFRMSLFQNAIFEAHYKENKDLRVLYENIPDDRRRKKGLIFYCIISKLQFF